MSLPLPLITRPAVPAAVPEADWQEPAPVPAGEVRDDAEQAGAQLTLLTGGQMTWLDQSRAALAHAFRVAHLRSAELRAREGGIVHGLMRAQPPSVQDQCDYAHDRAWLPPGTEGGTLEGMGAIYHALAGKPGVAVGNAISALHARPLRWCIAAVVSAALAVILLAITGHSLAAWLTGVGVLALAGLWAGAGWLLMCLLRPQVYEETPREDPGIYDDGTED
jgi:hypothetical protein